MVSVQRYLHNALAILLQIDPAQRISVILIILAFLYALNLSSSVLYQALSGSLWGVLGMALAPLIPFALILLWLSSSARRRQAAEEPRLTSLAPYPGLIWMVSIFHARVTDHAGKEERYTIDDLQRALATSPIDYTMIKTMVESPSSNLRPLIATIRHHQANHTLQHLWLISTADQAQQLGSYHLAPLIKQLLHQVYCYTHINVYWDDPQLIVHPHQVTDTYRAVHYIFQHDAVRLGLTPSEIIADITGGRVPMSCGMILACTPNDWPLEFTSTEFDPATNHKPDTPLPMKIAVDQRTVLRQTLDAAGRRL